MLYNASKISESVARTSNTEVNADALRGSVKRFVENFKCLKKNIGRNWEKISRIIGS